MPRIASAALLRWQRILLRLGREAVTRLHWQRVVRHLRRLAFRRRLWSHLGVLLRLTKDRGQLQ